MKNFTNFIFTMGAYRPNDNPHNKTLIAKTTELNDQDFTTRSIYKDSY